MIMQIAPNIITQGTPEECARFLDVMRQISEKIDNDKFNDFMRNLTENNGGMNNGQADNSEEVQQ